MPIADPWFYLCAIPAVLIMGVSKGGFGSGFGILAVPLMTLAVPPQQAAAIMLPLLCVMDLVGIRAFRGQWDRRNMVILIPGAMLGIAIGALTFRWLSVPWILLMLALLSFGFLLYQGLRARLLANLDQTGPHWGKGSFWGALSGFTSFVAHAGGPPITVYLLPQRLDKTVFVATNVLFFALVNYVKLIPYAWLGQFDRPTLATVGVLLPLAPLGVWAGMALMKRLSDRWFYGLCYVLTGVTGAKLLWDALFGRDGLLGGLLIAG